MRNSYLVHLLLRFWCFCVCVPVSWLKLHVGGKPILYESGRMLLGLKLQLELGSVGPHSEGGGYYLNFLNLEFYS